MIHPIKFMADCDVLPVRGGVLELLKKKPQQILWIRGGIYGIIPIEQVKTRLSLAEEYQIIPDDVVKFSWSEVVVIPKPTGRAMADYNGGQNRAV